jgi:hypothetical protein
MSLTKVAEDYGGKQDSELLARIAAEVKAMAEMRLLSSDIEGVKGLWRDRIEQEPKRLINSDLSINTDALRNFWRRQIFVLDLPDGRIGRFNPWNVLDGRHRGVQTFVRELLAVILQHGYGDLLKKYPCPLVGNPRVVHQNGYRFTMRWLRNIYFAGLTDQVLKGKIGDDFVMLDIGGSFGGVSSLVKRENPGSHQVLVDFSEQLILAHYFLGKLFPDARIAGVNELSKIERIDKNTIQQYDFCLIPPQMYSRIAPGSIDLVTSFTALAEMPRKWFDYYLESPVFKSAKYFLTICSVQAPPIYETDINILDYPIWDAGKRLHFAMTPVYFAGYGRYKRFFSRRSVPVHIFEYAGEI